MKEKQNSDVSSDASQSRSEEEESTTEDASTSYEEDSSNEEISSKEEEEDPQLFTLQTGKCIGHYSRIELLVSHELKIFDREMLTDEIKESIFRGINVWTEAESTDRDPWITSFFSFVPYEEIASSLHPEVQAEIGKMKNTPKKTLFINGRFINIPDEVVFEMYQALSGKIAATDYDQILFLSLERPITQWEIKQIRRAFPSLNIAKMKNMFPMYAEEIFLTVENISPSFVCRKDTFIIKGYSMSKQSLMEFIVSLKEYFSAS